MDDQKGAATQELNWAQFHLDVIERLKYLIINIHFFQLINSKD